MIRLSRENWRAILAETDNDREWLPGPHQPGVHVLTGLEVGTDEVQGWMTALTMAEDLLEARALLPHFRITGQGIDMKRFFEEPQAFDFVPMITGPGVVPYLGQRPHPDGRAVRGDAEPVRRRGLHALRAVRQLERALDNESPRLTKIMPDAGLNQTAPVLLNQPIRAVAFVREAGSRPGASQPVLVRTHRLVRC